MACVTGNATTLTMTVDPPPVGSPITPGITATLVAIGDISESGVAIDDNDLVAGTLDKKCAGDLITYEPLEFTVKYLDADAGDLDNNIPYSVLSGVLLTFSSGDTYAFSAGTLLSRTVTGIDNNNRVLVTYVIQPTVAGVYAVVV